MEQHWIAVRSKPRAEKVALQQLEKNGIEAYLPLVRQKRKWSDRMKWVELPLLSSYLFVRIELKNSIFVLETHGISTIVKFSGSIAIVQDEVIKSIRLALEGGYELEPTEYFSVGDEVEVFEDTPAADTILGVDVFPVIHKKTKQKIFVSSEDIKELDIGDL